MSIDGLPKVSPQFSQVEAHKHSEASRRPIYDWIKAHKKHAVNSALKEDPTGKKLVDLFEHARTFLQDHDASRVKKFCHSVRRYLIKLSQNSDENREESASILPAQMNRFMQIEKQHQASKENSKYILPDGELDVEKLSVKTSLYHWINTNKKPVKKAIEEDPSGRMVVDLYAKALEVLSNHPNAKRVKKLPGKIAETLSKVSISPEQTERFKKLSEEFEGLQKNREDVSSSNSSALPKQRQGIKLEDGEEPDESQEEAVSSSSNAANDASLQQDQEVQQQEDADWVKVEKPDTEAV